MTAMDVPALVAALRKATPADQRLPFTGHVVGSSDLDALLGLYFTGGTVTVADASVNPSADGKSAVVSGRVTYGAADCSAGLVLTPTANDVSLVLTLTPPGGWSLPQPFPGVLDPTLSGLTFATGGLVICSAPYQEPSQHLTLARGMTLVATLDLTESYPLLTAVLGTAPVAVHGVVTDANLPQMVLVTDPRPASLGSVQLAEVTMTFTLGTIADAGQQPISLATAAVQASVALSGSIGGTVTATLPEAGSLLDLDVAFANVTLAELSLLEPYLGAVDPIAGLPAEVSTALKQAGSAFQLSSLALRFDAAAMRFLSVGVVVTVDLKGFTPFPVLPSLKIDDLVLTFAVDLAASPPTTTFAATADIDVTSTCQVALGVQTQPGDDYVIHVRQNTAGSLQLSDLVKVFLPGLPLPELAVSDLAITLAPRADQYTFTAVIDGSWTVLQSIGIELATVEVSAAYLGSLTPALSGSIAGVLQLDLGSGGVAATSDDTGVDPPPPVIDLLLTASQPAGGNGWLLTGATGPDQLVPVGDLMAALARKFGVHSTSPAAISNLTMQNLGVRFDTVTQHFEFACQLDVDIEGKPVEVVVTVSVTPNGTGYDLAFGGTILVGPLEFGLYFDQSGTSTSLVAVYTHRPGDPAHMALRDLVAAISPTAAAAVPADIDIQLDGVKLVFIQQDSGTEFAFGLDLSLSFGLSDLPLVGSALPDTAVSIQHLQLLYSRTALTAAQAADVNGRLPSTVAPLPAAGLSPGVAVAATLLVGGEVRNIAFGVPSNDSSAALPFGPSDGQQQLAAGSSPPSTRAGGTWLDIGRTFGPLRIERLGLEYAHGTLIFAVDGDIAFGPLTLSLEGLGFGSPLAAFSPVFTLTGLGLSYTTPPLEMAGGMLRVPDSQLAPGVQLQFDGQLVVKAEDFSLAALGSYAQLATGLPSLFVFAELATPLGGPPAFFVTGLMGGFGLNRSLTIPAQDEVASFPLLALSGTPQDPTQVLRVLEGEAPSGGVTKAWITPKAGEYWLAAGVEFTSFKVVNTKALVVAEFGRELTLALLGRSTMQLPLPEADSPTYAYVEMMIRVVVQPTQGYLAATAILSDNSYVLTPDCRLTGGFAFSLWFGDNPDAGQFVLTLGGYHPAFAIPANFPRVPRLGFNWAVSDQVSIKGSAYFALTSSCAMAGGGLEVLFHDGDLRAWFTAQADFLISWHPFWYTARIAVSIGVSYRLNLLFCHKTISLSLGADLSMWGPPTGGVVRIKLVVVSFSVRFGSDGAESATQPLGWRDFRALLPAQTDVCSITITDGLFKTQDAPGSPGGEVWIVRAKRLAFQTRSAVPASQLAYGGNTVQRSGTAPNGIAIKPMNRTGVTSTHTLSIYRGDSATPIDTTGWSLEPLPQTMPASLWSAPPTPFSQIPASPTADVLPDELCGFSVTAPTPQPGNSRGPVSVGLLMEEYLSPPGQAPLSATVTPSSDYLPTPDQHTVGLLQQVSTGAAQQGRSALFGVLAGAVMPDGSPLFTGVNGDLSVLAADAGHLFSDSPAQQN